MNGLIERYQSEQQAIESNLFDVHLIGNIPLSDLYSMSKRQLTLMVNRLNDINKKKSGNKKQYL